MPAAIKRAGSYHETQHILRLGVTPPRATIDVVSDTSLRTQHNYEVEVVVTVHGTGPPYYRLVVAQVGRREAIWTTGSPHWKCWPASPAPGPPSYVNLSKGRLLAAAFSGYTKIGKEAVTRFQVRSRGVRNQPPNVVFATTLYLDKKRSLPVSESAFFRPPDGPKGNLTAREWATATYSHWGEKVSVKLPIKCP